MSRSEKVILAALCMVYSENKILLQDKVSNWVGLTLPGGHIEKNESFVEGITREIFEETGLTIHNLKLCGTKQFQTDDNERYIVFCYKTNNFSGELKSSSEGKMVWVDKNELVNKKFAPGFLDTLKLFNDDNINEMVYDKEKSDDGSIRWLLKYY